MEEKNLIEKLEKTSLPEIEIPNHKRKLRTLLIDRYFREKRGWEIFNIFRKFAPVGVLGVLLMILIINNLIYPTYSLAKAKEIALRDPQIKELIEKGAIIKDIEIIKNKAYILVQTSEEVLVQPQKEMKEPTTVAKPEIQKMREESVGALAEIDFKEKRVTKFEELTPEIIPLTEKDKEKAKEIAKNDPEIQKVIPKEAEILKIKSYPPQLKLIREGNSIQVLPEPEAEKKASVIYKFDKKQWEGKINLSEEKVEEVKFLGEIEE